MEAYEGLMEPGQVINAMKLVAAFCVYFIPSAVIIGVIVIVARSIKKNKNRKEISKERSEKIKEATDIIIDSEKAINVLDDIGDEPKDKEKFMTLFLEFDEEGHVIQ